MVKMYPIKTITIKCLFLIFIVMFLTCDSNLETFIEIKENPQIVFPDCGNHKINGFDEKSCKLTYAYIPTDPENCEHHKPILKWTKPEGTDFFEVYINGVFYAKTYDTEIEIGGYNPMNPKTNLLKIPASVNPYRWHVKAINEFQVSLSNICYFNLWDDICPEINLYTPDENIILNTPDEEIYISLFVEDQTIIKSLRINVDDEITKILVNENEYGIEYLMKEIAIPSNCGIKLKTEHNIEICVEDMYNNKCCEDETFSVYCRTPEIIDDTKCNIPEVFSVDGPYVGEKYDNPPVLKWDEMECVNFYKVYYRKNKTTDEKEIMLSSDELSFDFDSIQDFKGGIYQWIVEVYFTNGDMLTSEVGLFELSGCSDKKFMKGPCGFDICGTSSDSEITWIGVPGTVFYRISDAYNKNIAYPYDIFPHEIYDFNIKNWYPDFGAKCSLKILACLERTPNGIEGDYFSCNCWVESEIVGVVCENVGTANPQCGKILTGSEGCPCTNNHLCNPGTGCPGQSCP